MKKLFSSVVILMLCFFSGAQVITYEGYHQQCCYEISDKRLNEKIHALNIPSLSPAIILFKPIQSKKNPTFFSRKIFYENLIILKDSDYKITIDPVFDFRYGKDDGTSIYKNTRGFILNGKIEKNFFVRSEFYENQVALPQYASDWVDTMKFIPGMINAKPFGTHGFDYGVVFSQIMWQPLKNYGIRIGYDRFHIGKGYRSLILSDASQAYPFLMNTFTHKTWSLSHNIASLHNSDFNRLMNISRSESGVFQQKWFSFTYLTYSPKSWLNLGLFESIIFMPADSTGISFYPMSMLPVPLVRTITAELKGLHHAIVGLQVDATLKESIVFYSQLVADKIDFSKLKYQQGIQGAVQIGAVLNAPDDSYLFVECNVSTNNAYTSSCAWTTYSNLDQPLAHPTGQQFKEIVAGARWQYNRFFTDAKFNYIWAGALPVTDNYLRADNYPDILLNGFYEPINRPDRVMHLGCTVSYYINPVTDFVVFAGMHYRNFHSTLATVPVNSLTYEIGFRHMIRKQYYDFF